MNNPVADKQACTAGFRHLSKLEPNSLGQYHVRIMRNDISVHEWFDQHGLQTPAWTFDGQMPGKLIEVAQSQQAHVCYANHVPERDPIPFAARLDADSAEPMAGDMDDMHQMHDMSHMHHAAWIKNGLVPEFVIHLHGAVVQPMYDGNPGVSQAIKLGEREDCVYDNGQRPALLWYHDHGMGQTAGTVYAGLAAPYVVRGEDEQDLATDYGLPHGSRELFLILQDKSFEVDAQGSPTGRFTYHIEPNKEWAGEDLLTNGRLRPALEVEQQPYRLRVLNATNGRFLKLYLRKGDDNTTLTVAPVTWIGADGGLLPAAIPADPQQGIFMPPAVRADVVIDFVELSPGPWKLVSRIFDAKNPYNNGDQDETDDADIDVIMQFNVTPAAGEYAPFTPPPRLSTDEPSREELLAMIESGEIAPRDVDMSLTEVEGPPLMQFINGVGFHEPIDPAREVFQAGEWIRLRIRNDTADAHPIHLHLVSFWVEGRSAAAFTPTQETGLLDSVWCPPGSGGAVTTILFHLPNDPLLTGRYMFHCHILEHEDHDMMRPFDVIPGLGT
jgi:FtsP/CotA-like multicopper oxidase with cupredoxin domain